jgi:predicted acylesterase/phospholipase RssA
MSEVSVVFAGGGCRTFWALGAYVTLADLLRPVEIAGVSAGAAMSLAAATGQETELVEAFCARTAKNPRNVYPERLLFGGPLFPQEAMYRATIHELLGDAGLQRLARGPQVKILQAYVEPGRPVLSTVASAWWKYAGRRRRGVLHGPETPHPGIVAEVDTAHESRDLDELADRVLRSSASPPVTKVQRVEGRTYLDGSLVCPVPVRALGAQARAGTVLVFLNRPSAEEAVAGNLRYIAPSAPVPIHKWDYTSPTRVRRAFDAGRRDGEGLREVIARFLESRGERREPA